MILWFAIPVPMFELNASLIKKYKAVYRSAKSDRILQLIIGCKPKDPELGTTNYSDVGGAHKQVCKSKRDTNFFEQMLKFSPLFVEEDKYHQAADCVPIIFEESFIKGQQIDKETVKKGVDDRSHKRARSSSNDAVLSSDLYLFKGNL